MTKAILTLEDDGGKVNATVEFCEGFDENSDAHVLAAFAMQKIGEVNRADPDTAVKAGGDEGAQP